jgi:hypothetical protein
MMVHQVKYFLAVKHNTRICPNALFQCCLHGDVPGAVIALPFALPEHTTNPAADLLANMHCPSLPIDIVNIKME